MLSQVRSGALDIFTVGSPLANVIPVSAIPSIAFAFPNFDGVWAAVDGDLGGHIRQQIGTIGLVAFDKMWDNGFRQITTSNKPINDPNDLKGLKLRVPVSPLFTSMFRALGTSPTAINFVEVYTALQTKVVDGQENPLALIEAAKFYEVQKFCSLTGHMWEGFWMVANKRNFEQLPQDLRATTMKLLNEGAVKQRADMAALNATLETQLKEKGLTFNTVNKKPFQEALKSGGLLRRVARQIRRRGLEGAGALQRRAVLTVSCRTHLTRAALPAPSAWIARTEQALGVAVALVAAAILLFEVGLLFVGVIARYFFHRPLIWADELASTLFVWLSVLGAVLAMRRNAHMRLTTFIGRAGPVLRQQIETAVLLVIAAFVLLIVWPAIEYAIDEAIVRTPGLDISNSWRASAVAAGAILIAVFSLLRLAVTAPSLKFLAASVASPCSSAWRSGSRARCSWASATTISRSSSFSVSPCWSRPACRLRLRSASRRSAMWRSRRARR